MQKIKRVLISVSNKAGLVEFAKRLADLGCEILSTGGTAKILREHKIKHREVSEVTGFPEILDGRVKTLHPKIHGGLLALRDSPEHMEQLKTHRIQPIDMVVVNLYPFEQTVARPDCTFEEAIEQIDIGGPAMLRSAAKNFKDVAVIVDPVDYQKVLEELETHQGALTEKLRMELARKVFFHTAHYDSLISQYFEKIGQSSASGGLGGEAAVHFPQLLHLCYEKVQNLRYGENPHQLAAFYRDFSSTEPSVARARQIQGKEMSFNNFLDAHAALELAKEFKEPAAIIVKHNNPCGVAVDEVPVEAYRKARETDPVSAFGGVIAFNFRVDAETAKEICSTFVEVVIAPGFETDALDHFSKKKALRLLDLGGPLHGALEPMDFKKVTGGLLLQERDLGKIEDIHRLKVVTKRRPNPEEYEAMAFAWKVAKHVKSNAIVYAKANQTLGIGAGQMSRVDSVKLGAMKAVLPLQGSVVASDAFFPFRDGIDAAAQVGVTALIQPGGSIRDEEVIAAADEHGMAMVFTQMRHFRH
jgi:phosphoribosylaminoimidazolecarboxamide formyltransferase/IMP cyclohydrolase